MSGKGPSVWPTWARYHWAREGGRWAWLCVGDFPSSLFLFPSHRSFRNYEEGKTPPPTMLLSLHGKSWGLRRGEQGPLLGAHIGAEEAPVATLAFLVSPSRISHIAGLRTRKGMSWVSLGWGQGAGCAVWSRRKSSPCLRSHNYIIDNIRSCL